MRQSQVIIHIVKYNLTARTYLILQNHFLPSLANLFAGDALCCKRWTSSKLWKLCQKASTSCFIVRKAGQFKTCLVRGARFWASPNPNHIQFRPNQYSDPHWRTRLQYADIWRQSSYLEPVLPRTGSHHKLINRHFISPCLPRKSAWSWAIKLYHSRHRNCASHHVTQIASKSDHTAPEICPVDLYHPMFQSNQEIVSNWIPLFQRNQREAETTNCITLSLCQEYQRKLRKLTCL